MKNNVLITVPSSVAAVAALVLSFRSQVSVESAIGYLCVFALMLMTSLEYRITWKRVFGRT
jgi:hypothetical protein